ncbi:MAG: TetR family transcriptional regulator [Phycisphaerae bacterium]|nr:hypothetical protein [Phycisphaerales bacterium]
MADRQPTRSVADLLGVPPPPATGRDRIISAGIELFYRYGFATVGLDAVIERAGVTKTTFYKHFESKDELVEECVKSRDEWESAAWTAAARKLGGDSPRGQLLAYFDVLDAWFNDPEFRGCVFINAATEFADRRHPVHRAAAEHKRRTREEFRRLATLAGAEDPAALADELTILLEGTLVLRHVHDRDDAALVARVAAERVLSEHLDRR